MKWTRIARAWKHLDGTPVCEECGDSQILNQQEIAGYWNAVDQAMAEFKEEGIRRNTSHWREPVEERCEADSLHSCKTCGVDIKELDDLQPRWDVEMEQLEGNKVVGRSNSVFCSESCMSGSFGEAEVRWILNHAVEIRKGK